MDPVDSFTPSSSVRTYLLIFLPVIVLPLLVLTVRAVRWVWSRFQPLNEYGEKDISDLHKKWRGGFARFRLFMETSEFGRLWVLPSHPFPIGLSMVVLLRLRLRLLPMSAFEAQCPTSHPPFSSLWYALLSCTYHHLCPFHFVCRVLPWACADDPPR